jgi:hypothetical protein
MPFEWKALLDVAIQLETEANHEPAHAEALRRTAVGRAYYAAFCHARNYEALTKPLFLKNIAR